LDNPRRYIVALSTIILLAAVTFIMIIQGNRTNNDPDPGVYKENNSMIGKKVETSVFQAEEGWGYDIYLNGERYIHQPTIPVVQGNKGFKNEKEAKQVAELVAEKIRNDIIPPTISSEELDSLGITK